MLAYAAARAPSFEGLIAAVGGLGAVLLAIVLTRGLLEALPWSFVLLAAAYVISLYVRGSGVDEGAPLVATGMLACGELAAWSVDERRRIAAERAVVDRRATALVALVLGGLAVSALVLALAAAPVGGGLAWTIVGATASVIVLGVAVQLARR